MWICYEFQVLKELETNKHDKDMDIIITNTTFWNSEKPIIIPRESWWANELYNSKTWEYWVNILKKRSEYVAPTRSESQQETTKEKIEKIESYLYGNFLDQFTSEETLYSKNDWDYTYAWPIKYTESVDAIVIHHTHSEYENSLMVRYRI